jgi:hypothetical protein
MIYWHEYKQYKIEAEKLLADGSDNDEIEIQVLKYRLKEITREQATEQIINILSNYEHLNSLS